MEGRKYPVGDIGLHHYAFRLRSRKDVDDLQDYLQPHHVTVVNPAGVYDEGCYAAFVLAPDGVKLEGPRYRKKKRKPEKDEVGAGGCKYVR